MEKIRNLIDKLNYYTKLYDAGRPEITDKEWDDMYFELLDLEKETGIIYPDSPSQSIHFEEVSKLEKVEHNHPMLSLDKTKDWEEFVEYFKGHSVVGMCKLDGLTCCLTYENGTLVSAETRGNGIIGENILHNAKVIKSIPTKINYDKRLVIDGEMICTTENFKKFSEDYKNPRNFASGSIRLLDSKECKKRNLTFVVWNVVDGPYDTVIDNLKFVYDLDFLITPWVSSFDLDAKDFLIEQAKIYGYPIDGLVGRFNEIAYGESLGATAHHSRAAYAFKFYDEIYDTYLRDIEWTMGRTGVLTPVAVFDPIDIEGSVVERASLHNWTIMMETIGHPFKGQRVSVFKANMIIPQICDADIQKITEHADEHEYIPRPTICPVCGEEVRLEESDGGTINLICLNPQCDGKLINQIDHFVGKKGLDIKGLSKATIEKLIDWGWLTCKKDIFELYAHKDEWIKKPGFGPTSVNKVLATIDAAKNTKLETFIASLGIPLIGSVLSKEIVKHVKSYPELRELVDNNYNFFLWDGFASVKSDSLSNFDYTEADEIYKYLNIPEVTEEVTGSKNLENQVFVITGKLINFKNRDELKEQIMARGGKVVDSVSSKTTCLINNDKESNSSKNKKALSIGVPILNETEFLKKYFDFE